VWSCATSNLRLTMAALRAARGACKPAGSYNYQDTDLHVPGQLLTLARQVFYKHMG